MLKSAPQTKQEEKLRELSAQLAVRERLHQAQLRALSSQHSQIEARAEALQQKNTELEQENAQLKTQVSEYCETNLLLKEEIAWLKRQLFGRSSEKQMQDAAEVAEQRMLFNEAEVLAAIAAADAAEAAAAVVVPAHERKKKSGSKVIPAEFPREIVPHDLPESEKVCPHDGTPLQRMGAERAERYHYEAPKLIVRVHERYKYSCPCCREGVRTAALPAHILPKSMAEPSLLAQITTDKYDHGTPLTRQSRKFAHLGLELGSGTMGTWVNTIGAERVPPLVNLMHEAALAEPVLHCDETTVQVLKSEKSAQSDHYMIVRAAGPPGRRIVIFTYAPSRNVETLKQVLTGPAGSYSGKLITDGLELYDWVAQDSAFAGMTLCGCLAHCRRYFDRAAKLTELAGAEQLARVALKDYLGKVFYVERQIDEQREAREHAGGVWELGDTLKVRQERSVPLMSAFKEWVDKLTPQVPPKSALGKAFSYTTNQWSKLTRFLEHPQVPPHNNRVENDIRPFVVGRRSWLFLDTQLGARASANLYTIVGTCRANGINTFAYLTHLYEQLPLARTVTDLEALLPWNVKPLLKTAASNA
ncbi:MAG: IS66 family transposase [Gammaproteobacteria bacterium]|nr:IS66 family transposase [Gammaproteobacteria bacterium]